MKNQLTILLTIILPFTSIASDNDNDGLPDEWEILYGLDTNSAFFGSDADMDGDGFTNGEEYIAGTHPYNADTDDDGMADGWEGMYNLNPLTNDANTDLDFDNYSAIAEYTFGTSPTNHEDYFTFEIAVDEQVSDEIILQWPHLWETTYFIDYSENLTNQTWLINSNAIWRANGTATVSISVSTNRCNFYRIRGNRSPHQNYVPL